VTAEGRERLRQAAFANKPWQHSTGPKSVQGKTKAALNSKARQAGESSAREVRRLLAGLTGLVRDMGTLRRRVQASPGGQEGVP